MTEKTHEEIMLECRKIWCPYACVLHVTGGSGNREMNGQPLEGTHCLGRRCGMWNHAEEKPGC